MKDLSIVILISICFWLTAVVYFYRTVKIKQSDIWEAIKGENKILDKDEIALLYWVWLFPIMVFAIWLMAITGLELKEYHIDLIKWIIGSLDLIALALLYNKKVEI